MEKYNILIQDINPFMQYDNRQRFGDHRDNHDPTNQIRASLSQSLSEKNLRKRANLLKRQDDKAD